jgi:hypothetical protein
VSIQGKKIALVKHTAEVASSIIDNVRHNLNNPILLDLGLIHIKAQADFTRRQIQCIPADRFNDDGTLKPEDMTGKTIVAAGGGNPEGLRSMLNDVLKDSGFKVEGEV